MSDKKKFNHFNSKFKVIRKNKHFEYTGGHGIKNLFWREKSLKFVPFQLQVCIFSTKFFKQLAILRSLESTWRIAFAFLIRPSKWFLLASQRKIQSQSCFLHTIHLGILKNCFSLLLIKNEKQFYIVHQTITLKGGHISKCQRKKVRYITLAWCSKIEACPPSFLFFLNVWAEIIQNFPSSKLLLPPYALPVPKQHWLQRKEKISQSEKQQNSFLCSLQKVSFSFSANLKGQIRLYDIQCSMHVLQSAKYSTSLSTS